MKMTLLDLTRFAFILSMELMFFILAIIDQTIWILAENMESKQARQKATTEYDAATKFLLEEEQPRAFIPIPIRQTLYQSNTKPVASHSPPVDSKLQEKEMRCPVLHKDAAKKRLFSEEKQKQQRSFIPVPIRQKKLYQSTPKPVVSQLPNLEPTVQEKKMPCQNMRCPTFTSSERVGAKCIRKTNRVSAKPPVSAPTAVRRWRY